MEISRKTLADTTFSMERNLLDHIISTYLGDSTDEDAIRLLLLPAAARHVVKHLQAEKAWIVTSYETRYGLRQLVQCTKLSKDPANELLVHSKDGKMTLTGHFLERHDIELKYPGVPALQFGRGKKKLFYPLELLDILFL